MYLSNEVPNNGYLDLNWDFEQAYRFLRAMDYRGMNIMPTPKVELKGKTFFIDAYKIGNAVSPLKKTELCIAADYQDNFLVCQLRKCE